MLQLGTNCTSFYNWRWNFNVIGRSRAAAWKWVSLVILFYLSIPHSMPTFPIFNWVLYRGLANVKIAIWLIVSEIYNWWKWFLKRVFLNVDLNDNNVSAVTDKIWWGRLLALANWEYKIMRLVVLALSHYALRATRSQWWPNNRWPFRICRRPPSWKRV